MIKQDLHSYVKAHSELVPKDENINLEPVTHTGQQFAIDDSHRVRFEGFTKLVNKNFAIDLVAQDPIVVANQRVVHSSSAGPLGHPKVYINLDSNDEHVCGYSGRRFVHKKFYDEKKHGKAITYDQYLEELHKQEQRFIRNSN